MTDKNFVTKEDFDEAINSLKKKIKKSEHLNPDAKQKEPRKPSDYNLFLKNKINEYKSEDPSISNKEAFKRGADDWNKFKESKKVEPKKVESKKVESKKD